MNTFLIEAQKKLSSFGRLITLPAQDFGDTAIRMIDFWNWYHSNEKPYLFELFEPIKEDKDNKALISAFKTLYDDKNIIPIGSVEFVLSWFKALGIDNIKPLNIPRELWHFCDRQIAIGNLCDFNGHFMKKDIDLIKSEDNGEVELLNDETSNKDFFLSEWLNDVESEWRVFVFGSKILGIRCYSGDFWKMPDKNYIEQIVKEYDNSSYTLDVMVTPKKTEILELHDFFSCGLYGFEDTLLPLMWKSTIHNIVRRYKSVD